MRNKESAKQGVSKMIKLMINIALRLLAVLLIGVVCAEPAMKPGTAQTTPMRSTARRRSAMLIISLIIFDSPCLALSLLRIDQLCNIAMEHNLLFSYAHYRR